MFSTTLSRSILSVVNRLIEKLFIKLGITAKVVSSSRSLRFNNVEWLNCTCSYSYRLLTEMETPWYNIQTSIIWL